MCIRDSNEGDDPTMTNPIMYSRIKDQPSTQDIYAKRLIAEGLLTQAEFDKMVTDFDNFLDAEFEKGKEYKPQKADWLDGVWTGLGLPASAVSYTHIDVYKRQSYRTSRTSHGSCWRDYFWW